MRYSSSFVFFAPLLVHAAPFRRTISANDMTVFQFANVLNQLELNFYQQGMQKFQDTDITSAGFLSAQAVTEQFNNIISDETSHISTLQNAITSFGGQPLSGCNFDVSSAIADLPTMSATGRVFEMVGVSAFLGAATLLDDPVLLDAAASILTTEARHSTILNMFNSGTSIPSAFDIPLTPSEILALAGSFISGCDLGVPANPSLSVTNTGTIQPGTSLTFASSALNETTSGLFCQMLLGGLATSIPLCLDECVVPQGVNGPVMIWITSDGQPLLNNVVDRATSQLVAGPALLFVDSEPDSLSQFIRTSGTDSASTVVRTITPAQASAIMASASAAPTSS